MEIITGNPIISIILAILSVLGVGIVVRINSKKNSNRVKQSNNKSKGNISGRDTIINNDVKRK